MPPQQGVQQNGMMPQQYAQQNFAAPTGSIVESTGYGRSGWERKHSICAGGLCFLALARVVTFIIVTVTDVFKSDDTRTLVQVVSILCCGPLGFFMLFALSHHFRNPGLSPGFGGYGSHYSHYGGFGSGGFGGDGGGGDGGGGDGGGG